MFVKSLKLRVITAVFIKSRRVGNWGSGKALQSKAKYTQAWVYEDCEAGELTGDLKPV